LLQNSFSYCLKFRGNRSQWTTYQLSRFWCIWMDVDEKWGSWT